MRRVPLFSLVGLLLTAVSLLALCFAPARTRPKPLSLGDLINAPLQELAVAVGAAPVPTPPDTSPAKLDARVKTFLCKVAGPLPDHDCTPGAIFASTTVETICTPGYTKTVRNVSTTLKKRVYKEYDITYPQPTGTYEADHLIPLELGGNNDIANLFPEAAAPTPGFKEKDLVENYLHNRVCAGDLPLGRAQEQAATNWIKVYDSLSPQQLAELKAQYSSWTAKN